MATKVIDKIVHNVPELNSPYEEADVSLVLHAAEAAKAGSKRLFLLSADTDIRVPKLYYWREFGWKGLNELWFSWLQAIERYIPIHKLEWASAWTGETSLPRRLHRAPFFWEDGHHIPSRRYGPYEEGQLKRYINFWRAD